MSRARPRRRGDSGSRVALGPRRLVEQGLKTGKFGALLLLAFALWGLFYVLTSPAYVVRSIQVLNSTLQPPSQVATLAGVRGRSLWLVDPRAVVRQLEQNSYIEQASVALRLPDHVTIAVEERQPSIRWSVKGKQFLVDKDAIVLGEAQEPLSNTLVVVDTFRSTLEPGERLDPDALELARILSVRLPGELNITPRRIEWDIGYGISVITEHEQQIAFGRNQGEKVSLDQKIATLGTVIKKDMPFQFIDLRSELPYLRQPTAVPTPNSQPPQDGEG